MDEKQIIEYVHTLPPQNFGLTAISTVQCERLTGGVHHLNFKATLSDTLTSQPFVLRFALKKEEAQALHNEHWYIHLLDASITPKSVFYTDSTPFGVPLLITQFVEGAHSDLNELTSERIKRLARLVYGMHGVKRDQFSVGDAMLPDHSGTLLDYANQAVAELIDVRYQEVSSVVDHDRELYQRVRGLLAEQLQAAGSSWSGDKFSLCHGDIGEGNILWDDERPYLIDWDGANFGDPANEIGYIFAINNVSPAWQQTFLDAYLQDQPQPTIPQRIDTYILKNRLGDLVWSLGKIEEAKAGSKLGITLEQAQAWYQERRDNLRQYLDNMAG